MHDVHFNISNLRNKIESLKILDLMIIIYAVTLQAVTFLPEFKYNKNESANDRIGVNASNIDENTQEIDATDAVNGEFVYAHLLESLIRSEHVSFIFFT